MPTGRTILIEFPGGLDNTMLYRIRNLGEDLVRQIEMTTLGDLGGIGTTDAATNTLTIHVPHARRVRRVRDMAEKIAGRHFPAGRHRISVQ